MIFKTEPKLFQTPTDPKGFAVEGISAEIAATEIGTKDTYLMAFKFYVIGPLGNYLMKDSIIRDVAAEVDIPKVGKIPLLSMLFSPKKEDCYNAVKALSSAYGYVLKPSEDQEWPNDTKMAIATAVAGE